MKQWTDGSISEGELADLFAQKVKNEWGLEMCSAGVSEAYRCIYPSKKVFQIISQRWMKAMDSIILLDYTLKGNMMSMVI